jgi:hypothetical protein
MRPYLWLWLYLELRAHQRRRRAAAAAWTRPEDGCFTHGTEDCDCESVVIPIARSHVWTRTEPRLLHSAGCWCWRATA